MGGDSVVAVVMGVLVGMALIFILYPLTGYAPQLWETWFARVVRNLKKNGGFIPGIRPGKNTATYLDYVLTRITVVGAAYLTFVCVLPEYVIAQTGIPLFFLGGTSLLIVVNVTVDTITQIQSHLLAHQYADLIKKAKLKGRLR